MPKKEEVAPVQLENVQEKQEAETVIYLGPTIKGVIQNGIILNNGMPKKAKEAVKEFPALKMLFVPIKGIVKARKDLKKEASALKICYNKAVEYAARKGESR